MRNKNASRKGASTARILIETFVFILWIGGVGFTGYYLGKNPAYSTPLECPHAATTADAVIAAQVEPTQTLQEIDEEELCTEELSDVTRSGLAAGSSEGIKELKRQWTCSKAEFADVMPKGLPIGDKELLAKTKWKSIIAVEPKAFFDMYLTQYPGDTAVVHPVIVFSHKILKGMRDIPDVCRVLDVAVVPNTPGTCVAVTETYHDVASYHMLHAGKQSDGSFSLTANSLDGRNIPDDAAYAGARSLLVDYFTHHNKVMNALKKLPSMTGRVLVGCLVDTLEDLSLYKNSIASANRAGGSDSFFVVTSLKEVVQAMKGTKVTAIRIEELAKVGNAVSTNVKRHFIQAWLAFAAADNAKSVMWQSPGAVWLDSPENILKSGPHPIETSWAYKGRNDPRSAPFFCSFDFFYHSSDDRPVHLFHEILLHTDLVIGWNSLDAVSSYRLAENNARYGTTSYVWPPFIVLHSELINHDAAQLKSVVSSDEKPMVVVVAHEGMPVGAAESLLKESGLWLV